MAILWGINGYFLSMLWGPIIKIISHWFPEKSSSKIVIWMSTSMIGGFLLAWGFVGLIISYSEWPWAFFIPGIILFVFSFVFFAFAKDSPTCIGLQPLLHIKTAVKKKSQHTLLWFVNTQKLWYVVIACYAQGIVKDGITLWGPTLIMETHHLDLNSVILFIPIMNFFGIMVANLLNRKFRSNTNLCVIILFSLGIIMLIGLIRLGVYSLILSILFLGLSSAMMYGANTILLGVIPLSFAKQGRSSSIVGFLDFNAYVAAGMSSAITGIIVTSIGWNGILIFWVIVSILGIVALIINYKKLKMRYISESI